MGIVADIENHGRAPRQDLETPWQRHARQALTNCLGRHWQTLTQCLERGQCRRGIEQLIRAPQGGIGQPPPAHDPTTIRPLLTISGIIEIDAKTPEVGADRTRMRQHRGRWERISNDRRALGSKDMCLFKANRLPIGAKPRGMVQIDTSQDRTVCVDPIDGVQAPAQAHFQNNRIKLGVFEHAQDGKGRKFEIGQLAVNLHTGRFDCAKLLDQLLSADRHATYARALGKVQKMWTGVQPDAKARSK